MPASQGMLAMFDLFATVPREWVAKTSSVHKPLICSDLRPSCYPLFFVL